MIVGALQENLLVLLTYDDKNALIIRGVVEPELWGGHYRTLAVRIYDFIDKYKKPPKDHLPDLLSDKLDSDNKREATLYEDVIGSIHAARTGINTQYVMSDLETFVKRQSLRAIGVELMTAL